MLLCLWNMEQALSNLDFFIKYILPFFSGFGILALVWNIINYYQAHKGFLKLALQCNSEYTQNDKLIISKTSVENTSKRAIRLYHALLIIVNYDFDIFDAVQLIVEETRDRTDKLIEINPEKEEEMRDYLNLLSELDSKKL